MQAMRCQTNQHPLLCVCISLAISYYVLHSINRLANVCMCTRETPRELKLPHGDVSSTTTGDPIMRVDAVYCPNIRIGSFLYHIVHIIFVARPPLVPTAQHSTPTSSATNKNSCKDEEFELWLHVRRESHVEYPRERNHPQYWR